MLSVRRISAWGPACGGYEWTAPEENQSRGALCFSGQIVEEDYGQGMLGS